ncbi:MAG: alcohol dehydrogenase catalytic domain-containing protein [Janthinobacterium lividum]
MSLPTSATYQVHPLDPHHSHTTPTHHENHRQTSIPKPTPGPGEVLIRIRAAALNYRDLLVLAGSPAYPATTSPGLTPLADGAGTIEATGANSIWAAYLDAGVIFVLNGRWADGDVEGTRVEDGLGSGAVHGTLRQYAVVKDSWVVRKPTNLSMLEAAAAGCAAGTAVNALGTVSVGKGTTVVALGTGGVSCFVIQVCFSFERYRRG